MVTLDIYLFIARGPGVCVGWRPEAGGLAPLAQQAPGEYTTFLVVCHLECSVEEA